MVLHASAIAGACAGLVPSIITCPLDVVKTKLQASSYQPSTSYHRPAPASAHPVEPPPWISRPGPSDLGTHAAAPGPTALRSPVLPPTPTPPPPPSRSHLHPSLQQQPQPQQSRPPPWTGPHAPPTSHSTSQYQGIVGTVRRIWIEDGFRGFYRGLGPTIFGYLPTWAIYFTVYDTAKAALASQNPRGEEDFVNHILSAMTAGAVSTCCTSPLWVVKTRFMLQSVRDEPSRRYRHTGDAFAQIWRTEGWRGFYRGLLPSLFGVSHVAVQFPLYESFKNMARRRRRRAIGSHAPHHDELGASSILICSSSAKMIASVVTYPHEVLRTRLQMQPHQAAAAVAAAAAAEASSRGEVTRGTGAHGGPTAPPRPPTPAPPTRSGASSRSLHTSAVPVSDTKSPPGRLRPSGRTSSAAPRHASTSSTTAQGASVPSSPTLGVRAKYTGVIQACRTIAAEEGIRGFYRGMGVNLLRTVPSSALTILTYELVMQQLNSDHDAPGNHRDAHPPAATSED